EAIRQAVVATPTSMPFSSRVWRGLVMARLVSDWAKWGIGIVLALTLTVATGAILIGNRNDSVPELSPSGTPSQAEPPAGPSAAPTDQSWLRERFPGAEIGQSFG